MYFSLSSKELSQALHVLESQSSEINDYNLSYSYDGDLNELPADPRSMDTYASLLVARSRVEMEKSASEKNWSQIVKSLGMAGSLRKMTGQFEEAEKLLQYCLSLIALNRLPSSYHVQQSIRICDVWKRIGAYERAVSGLSEIINLCTQDQSLHGYLDVALQHLGKVQYSSGHLEAALQSFERALALRIKKRDQELIESSETAIENCRLKMAGRK